MSRPVLRPIWTPRDSVDTAHQFHLELANAERGRRARVGRFLFSRSRFRRAAWFDRVSVLLLVGMLACLGVLAASPVRADAVSYAYAAHYAGAVCETLADYPSVPGVLGVMAGIREHSGLTNRQAAEVVVTSVTEVCPQFLFVLEAFAARGVLA